jgi:hypothetical protein
VREPPTASTGPFGFERSTLAPKEAPASSIMRMKLSGKKVRVDVDAGGLDHRTGILL